MNFLQWNPNQLNQESDTQYLADSQRASGAADPSLFPSATANKLFYQLTTFVTALAQALTNKGYTNITDVSLPNLTAALTNVMTQADMSAYAPKLSPALTGTPTAPTPGSADNSATIANTAWISAYFARLSYIAAAYQPLLGFTPVQQGGGAHQAGNKIFLGWDGVSLRAQVDATDLGDLATTAWTSANFETIGAAAAAYLTIANAASTYETIAAAAYQPLIGFTPVQQGGGIGQAANKVFIGWDGNNLRLTVDSTDQGVILGQVQYRENLSNVGHQRFPSGLIQQWGNASFPTGNADIVYLDESFSTGGFQILVNDYTSNCYAVSAQPNTVNSFKVWARNSSGAYTGGYCSYLAIGK